MTINLNRRHFLSASALAAGFASLPASLRAAQTGPLAWGPVRKTMQGFIDSKYVPGTVAAIGRGTQAPDFLSTGALAFDNPAPVAEDSLFRAYSMTKPITGIAAMMLIEDGKLKLDQNIADFLPGFANPRVLTDPEKSLGARAAAGPITIRNLLSHRSGLPNYVHFVEKLGWDTHNFVTNADILQLLIDNADKLKPGRANAYFDYCNTNYALLALIVEKVSQISFSDYLNKVFFKPLGMNNSFVFSIDMVETVLPSYKFNNQREPLMFLDAIYGDKNIYSTPRDMMKWDFALSKDQLFAEKTLEEAFKGYSYERRGTRNYGLGWRLVEMPTGKKIIYHNGWWHGNNTVFSRLPDDSTAIIVLGNKFNRSIYQAKKIAAIFKGYGIQSDDDE